MKASRLILHILLLGAFLYSCKKDSTDDDIYKDMFDMVHTLSKARSQFFVIYEQAEYPNKAIMLLSDWLEQLEEVNSTQTIDSTYIYIKMISGYTCVFHLIPTDDNGKVLTRGSAMTTGLKQFAASPSGGNCSNKIENLKVLFFDGDILLRTSNLEHDILKNSETDFEITQMLLEQCNLDAINSFHQYGLVILNTHGYPNGFQTGVTLKTGELNPPKDIEELKKIVLEQLGQRVIDAIKTHKFMMTYPLLVPFDEKIVSVEDILFLNPAADAASWSFAATSRLIETITLLSNTIIFGNMCYSGYTNFTGMPVGYTPIALAFQSRNPIAYYGYAYDDGRSRVVSDEFARMMQINFLNRLVQDHDSTGIVHLKADGNKYFEEEFIDWSTNKPTSQTGPYDGSRGYFYFEHFGNPTYCYAGCADEFTDPRDGQTYKTICIGNQVWMTENLRYSGNIPHVSGKANWTAIWNNGNPIEQPAWCYYANNAANDAIYGKLYNWYAVNTGSLCPPGWHIPTDAEWTELIDYLGGENVAGGKLKSTTGWQAPNTDATNESGFSGFPGGQCDMYGDFIYIGSTGRWWSSQESFSYTALSSNLYFFNGNMEKHHQHKTYGLSCRCVKD